jgi:hypothetical protein
MARFLNPLTHLREKQEGFRYHSPTGLETIIQCPRRRYLDKKVKKKVTSPSLAKGTHMHNRIEELRLHPYRKQLGKNQRYSSAKTFANVVGGDWHRQAINEGEMQGKKILWEYENQKYVLKNEIKEMCLRIYPILMKEQEENPPVVFKFYTKKGNIRFRTGYEFELIYKGRGLRGEIDEIRKEKDKIIVRDYKTGKWQFIEGKLDYAYQPTVYDLITCLECLNNEKFRNSLDITEEQAKNWIKNPEKMSEHIIFEYFMLDLPTEWNREKKEWETVEKDPIIRVKRSEFQYKELCQNIDYINIILSNLQDQRFYPALRGRHCNWCFYDGEECIEETNNANIEIRQKTFPEYLNSKNREYIIQNADKESPEITQTKFEFMKKVKKSRKPKPKI